MKSSGKNAETPAAPATETHPGSQPAGLQELSGLLDNWLARHRRPPGILYHYTNAQGLYGMLATGHLWATNISFLNDPSEMRYAARLIRSVMLEEEGRMKTEPQSEAQKRSGIRAALEKYFDSLTANLPTWTDSLLKTFEDEGDAYMSCFCTKGDLLSQWRGYGATGGGYAIGFSMRKVRSTDPAGGGLLLRQVIYKPQVQKEIVRSWVRTFLKLGQALAQSVRGPADADEIVSTKPAVSESAKREGGVLPDQPTGLFGALAWIGAALASLTDKSGTWERVHNNRRLLEQGKHVFTKLLAECLICFKDPAYAEEQEWRVIQFGRNAPEIKFRPSGPRVVPYVELNLTSSTDSTAHRLPLRSITYGPTLEPEVTAKSLGMLLKRYEYRQSEIEIKRSGIPFRM